jgi:alpha/beta superfamily hydrolase
MLTPVILTAEQAFQKAGYTTLAFNFRGVGGSAGTHGDGVAEVDDVTGAVEFLGEDLGSIPGRLAVAGYSFGSRVGAKVAATDSRVSLYLGIAPPLNLYDFAFLREAPCRVALIAGNRDEFCDIARLNALGAALPVAPWVRVVDGDHLLTASMQELEEACRAAIAWAEAGEPG